MKRLVIICALLISAVSFTKAQGGGGRNSGTPEERAQRTIDGQGFAAFSLTADQKPKVMAVLVAQNKSIDSLRAATPQGADMQATMQALRPKMTVIQQANDKKILALFNDEQKKAYTAYAEQRATRGGGGQGGGGR